MGNSNASSPTVPSERPSPWWREPMMWLVVGGPSLVVLASFATLGLALYFPDRALSPQEIAAHSQPGTAAHAPAVKARNHAATGGQ